MGFRYLTVTLAMKRFLFLDCDSTLSAIEGIDELARLKGPEVFAKVEDLTNQAMNGEVPIGEVFARRLDLIQPSAADCQTVGQQYIEHMPEGLEEALAEARKLGWTPVIISGGFVDCIHPLAEHLGIESIEAVPLEFDQTGAYQGYDLEAPTTRNGGKPEIIADYLKRHPESLSCMVGDGISDMECEEVADRFIACFCFVERAKLTEASPLQIRHFKELNSLLPT